MRSVIAATTLAATALLTLASPGLAEDRWMTVPHPGPMPEAASSGKAPVNDPSAAAVQAGLSPRHRAMARCTASRCSMRLTHSCANRCSESSSPA